MAGVTGLGSNINIDSIVKALVDAERAPKDAQLARVEKSATSKFSAVGQLKSAISDFQTALKDLNSADLFAKRSAKSSNTDLATVTATNKASAGTYQLTVEKLAAASKVGTASFAKGETAAAAGTLTVKLGPDDRGVDVQVAAGASLSEIRDSLNTALKDKGVSANIVSNPADGSSRLVLSSNTTGAGKDIYVQTSAGLEDFRIGQFADNNAASKPTGALAALDGASATSSGYITQAQDAEFTIDGLSLRSSSNTVSDAISDVTLNLVSAEPGKKFTVTVAEDTSSVKGNIKKFVDAYNKMIGVTKTLTAVTSVGESSAPVTGALVGDATVRSLLSTVRNELVNPSGQGGGISILSDLGITTQKDGTLKIDDTKLDKALSTQYESVAGFFTGENGLTSRLNGKLDVYTQAGGILSQRQDGLQSTLDSVKDQRTKLDERIAKVQTRLYAQYNAMDSLIANLNTTGDRLIQAISNLPGVVKQS
ncbi:flagellar filament capping protein FliD [Metapseudomonas resinovorans]|uniref:Flagellar hook-associated protein 2 n=1 Tax=Metapseudomonas resinovorans NBRC 106553 TaxID=1245471 RepID=S6AH19_METRE|nr:flagellar filament capping protein FliD [Pseudomonas resinovorans]BAN49742.1 flagellar hook-associated protein FliD [Pseudomonas resinovorans NBRC 106553]